MDMVSWCWTISRRLDLYLLSFPHPSSKFTSSSGQWAGWDALYDCPQTHSGQNSGPEICFSLTYLFGHENFVFNLSGLQFSHPSSFYSYCEKSQHQSYSALTSWETSVKSAYNQSGWIPSFLKETSFTPTCGPLCSLGWEHRWSCGKYAGNWKKSQ